MYHGQLKDAQPQCPVCKRILDGYSGQGDDNHRVPEEHDLTICTYCSVVCEYVLKDGTLDLRELSEEEISQYLELHPETAKDFIRALTVVKTMITSQARKN